MKPSAKICDEIRCPNYHVYKTECGVTGTIPGHMESCPKGRVNSYEELVEEIARFEHLQWVEWSKAIAESEPISPERLARWKKLWVPYSRLPEEQKEDDRKYARRVLKHLFKQGFVTVNAYPFNRVSGSAYATEKRADTRLSKQSFLKV